MKEKFLPKDRDEALKIEALKMLVDELYVQLVIQKTIDRGKPFDAGLLEATYHDSGFFQIMKCIMNLQ